MRTSYSDSCDLCAESLVGADNPCPECRGGQTAHVLDGLCSIGSWAGPLRGWLSLLKYGGDIRLINWVVNELMEIWTLKWKGLPVVPVPPRRGKIHREGRCLVAKLADELERNNVPVLRILRRRDKMAQKNLSRKERLTGERLNFYVYITAPIAGDVVLLDDVMTTGATLAKCANMLKGAGVRRVYAMVACRA